MSSAAERLLALAELRARKEQEYGDDYKMMGGVLCNMFPDGTLRLSGADDFGRFALFVQIMTKMLRYATNFHNGGHEDSLNDAAVYAAGLLAELDESCMS